MSSANSMQILLEHCLRFTILRILCFLILLFPFFRKYHQVIYREQVVDLETSSSSAALVCVLEWRDRLEDVENACMHCHEFLQVTKLWKSLPTYITHEWLYPPSVYSCVLIGYQSVKMPSHIFHT